MKYAKNIGVPIGLYEIGDAVVLEEKNAHIAWRMKVAMAHLGILRENLSPLEDSLNCATRRSRIIRGNVLENVLEPA